MTFLKLFIKFTIFAIALVCSLWVFAPWGKIGEYVVLSAEQRAAASGINVRHSSVAGSWSGPTINVNDFSAKVMFGGGSFKTITVSPAITDSVMSFSPVIYVSFTGGEVSMPGGAAASLGSGSFELSTSGGLIMISNLRSSGELILDGYVVIDPASAKIDNADMKIKAPDSLKQALSSMKAFLPLSEEQDGSWKLKREKGNA